MSESPLPERSVTIAVIRSGGQTGADRGALDAARALGVPIVGWCPRDGWAADFPDPPGLLAAYPELTPTPSADPAQRTRWNVRDADATLIVLRAGSGDSPGTEATRQAALELDRPVFLTGGADPAPIRAWLESIGIELTLNVAGPRESEAPGVYGRTRQLIHALLLDARPTIAVDA